MTTQTPVLDVLIGRDGDAWRLYVAATSWQPTVLQARMDERGSIFPVARPDLQNLNKFMLNVDCSCHKRLTADGGVEILARGRSAIAVFAWLERIILPSTSLTFKF
jgi:hypothetical protein